MKPPPFDYAAPATVEEAVAVLAGHDGDARILAGGQSLMPMLNFRLLEPSLLVDITRIPELKGIRDDGDGMTVGAATRHVDLQESELVRTRFPVLGAALSHVAHLAIRNRGTLGGSLSHADPAAELPMMAVLLDAEIRVAGVRGARTIAAEAFFLGALATDLADDEIVVSVRFPYPAGGTGWGFTEMARRCGDFALAAAATLIGVSGEHEVTEARIAVMGVDETPLRVAGAERLLVGRRLDSGAIADAARAVREAVTPNADLQASAEYRRHLAGVQVAGALAQAGERARGEEPLASGLNPGAPVAGTRARGSTGEER